MTLLQAMDKPPLRNGNVRKFIPIRNGDAYKLRQIFEYDSRNTRVLSPTQSRFAAKQIYNRNLPLTERYGNTSKLRLLMIARIFGRTTQLSIANEIS